MLGVRTKSSVEPSERQVMVPPEWKEPYLDKGGKTLEEDGKNPKRKYKETS